MISYTTMDTLGFTEVKSLEADDIGDQADEPSDGNIHTRPDVDRLLVRPGFD
jgi:hypothetical protein